MRKPVKSLVLLTIISFLFLNSDAFKAPMANGIAGDVKKVMKIFQQIYKPDGEVLISIPNQQTTTATLK
ncbi:MAG: hypothetical protein IPI78_12315 [Chitinophagaceae bacterium]|nr:hypothetical protein [Chitinophagaceae bacterium]